MTLGMTTTENFTNADNLTSENLDAGIQAVLDKEDAQNTDGEPVVKDEAVNNGKEVKTDTKQEEKAVEEPENKDGQDNTEDIKPKCPEKFLKDGAIDTEKLLNSYLEIEPVFNEKANWEKEKNNLTEQITQLQNQQMQIANLYGFKSPDEFKTYQEQMQTSLEVATLEANKYAEYLQLCENPQYVRGLLLQYQQNPTPQLMREIEEEFSTEINKEVAVLSANAKMQVEQAKQNQLLQTYQQEAQEFISNAMNTYPDMFKIQPFVNFFGECVKVAQNRFEVNRMVELLNGLKDHWINEYQTLKDQEKENQDATNKIAGTGIQQSAPAPNSNRDITNMSVEELGKVVEKYI